jgi:hypothetical protein
MGWIAIPGEVVTAHAEIGVSFVFPSDAIIPIA